MFDDKRLQQLINNRTKLTRKFGDQVAKKISLKLTQLAAFSNLGEVPTTPPFTRHNLKDDYKGCIGIDVIGRTNPMRIVLKPIHEKEGEISVDMYHEVTEVVVVFVGDYH